MSCSFYLKIEGTLNPTTSCSYDYLQKQPMATQIMLKEESYDLEEYVLLAQNFENFFEEAKDPLFWKKRIWTHMVISPYILSLSFCPINRSCCSLLFIQKKDVSSKIQGFIAPYLSKTDQKIYQTEKRFPPCYLIQDSITISQSIKWIEKKVQLHLWVILHFFLNDHQTSILTITFLHQKNYLTCGWFK